MEIYPDRWRVEIDQGLPPGVTVGDLLHSRENLPTIKQAYLLAVQSNQISDYLQRFDSHKIPPSCKGTVEAQLSKLRHVQNIVWNTMISLATGAVSVDDATLQTLLNKQAGETVTLLEMEKLANAIKLSGAHEWAAQIEALITQPSTVPQTTATVVMPRGGPPPTSSAALSAAGGLPVFQSEGQASGVTSTKKESNAQLIAL